MKDLKSALEEQVEFREDRFLAQFAKTKNMWLTYTFLGMEKAKSMPLIHLKVKAEVQ